MEHVRHASLWLMPYNRWGIHWALYLVDLAAKTIIHIDTLGSAPNTTDVIFI